MKTLLVDVTQLKAAGRWDIDFHLPPVGITAFPKNTLKPLSTAVEIIKKKRDPTLHPERMFNYVDISSVDVETGVIARPQDLTGAEAPSRARKVIHAYDIIISTCRPTRGAIAVVPEDLHGQICSTGFSVIRCKNGVNPFFLHLAIRLDSTLEQFRKWSTGSSYPAILDEDVAKTVVPLPDPATQDRIAKTVRDAVVQREIAIQAANDAWKATNDRIFAVLSSGTEMTDTESSKPLIYSIEQVQARIAALGPVEEEAANSEDELLLFDDDDDEAE